MPDAIGPEVLTSVLVIWIATLAIVVLFVVPIAVTLLRRALRAAWNIEHYLRDMRDAGLLIAGNTAAIPALDETIRTAVAMKTVADGIRDKSGVVAAMLAERADKGA